MKKWNLGRVLECFDDVISKEVIEPVYSKPYSTDDLNGVDMRDRVGNAYQIKYVGYGRGRLTNHSQGRSTCNNTSRRKCADNVTHFIIFTPYFDGVKFHDEFVDMYIVERAAVFTNRLFSYKKAGRDSYMTETQNKKLFNMSFFNRHGIRKAYRVEKVCTLSEICDLIED